MTLDIYDIMINAGYRRDLPADSELFPFLTEGYFIDSTNTTARKFFLKDGNFYEKVWGVDFQDSNDWVGYVYYDLQELSDWYCKKIIEKLKK